MVLVLLHVCGCSASVLVWLRWVCALVIALSMTAAVVLCQSTYLPGGAQAGIKGVMWRGGSLVILLGGPGHRSWQARACMPPWRPWSGLAHCSQRHCCWQGRVSMAAVSYTSCTDSVLHQVQRRYTSTRVKFLDLVDRLPTVAVASVLLSSADFGIPGAICNGGCFSATCQ